MGTDDAILRQVWADDGYGMLPVRIVRSNHGLPINSFKALVHLDGSMKLVTLVESIAFWIVWLNGV
jgi:hypothetical protein